MKPTYENYAIIVSEISEAAEKLNVKELAPRIKQICEIIHLKFIHKIE
jgi:hypothetical protein